MKQTVEKLVCKHFRVTRNQLHSHIRTARIAWARQVAYWVFRDWFSMSGPGIAEYFERSQPKTIYHGIQKVEDQMDAYPAVHEQLSSLRAKILETITIYDYE